MDFACRRHDPRVHALVVALDADDLPFAETWRRVGECAEELGLSRPSYHTIREVIRLERARRHARTESRKAALRVLEGALSQRVVDLPVALDSYEYAKARERLVSDRHKPP